MKNKKGFTIVELVIVIAVVAILAAVMIPTFAGIIKRANISSDIQTARNMGTILAAEKPSRPREAVDALKANGFERLQPKTKFYIFFWIKSKNIVILTDDALRPIFPEEMADARFDPNDWFDLINEYIDAESEEKEENVTPEPPAEMPEEPSTPPREFVNVTFTCNKPEYLKETLVNTTVSYGESYQFSITPNDDGQYWITKLAIYQGGEQLKTNYLSPDEGFTFSDKMTDDLEVNIHVVKYCKVTFKGEGIKTNHDLKVEWGVGALFTEDDLQKYFIPNGYEIASVTAKMGENTLNKVYDPEKKILHLSKITDDTEVEFKFCEKSNN